MGNCVDCVGGFKRSTRISPWKRNRTIVLCFLGIDGAGKTTVVKALQGEDLGTVHPTVGFSRAEFSLKKHKIVAYDLGGGERIREIWPTYYAEIYGIVYVVDSAAISRLAENKKIVDSLVERPELMGKPILFLLNKKDLPEAIDEMQFSDRFDLHNMAKSNKTDIRVEGICAVKGSGKEMDAVIGEGIEWLIERIVDNYANIEKGVQAALKSLQERQAQDRLERQHRLAMLAASRTEEHSEEGESSEPNEPTTSNHNALASALPNGNSVDVGDQDGEESRKESIASREGGDGGKRKSLPVLQPIKGNRVLPKRSDTIDTRNTSVDYGAFEVGAPAPTSPDNAGTMQQESTQENVPNRRKSKNSVHDANAMEMTTMPKETDGRRQSGSGNVKDAEEVNGV